MIPPSPSPLGVLSPQGLPLGAAVKYSPRNLIPGEGYMLRGKVGTKETCVVCGGSFTLQIIQTRTFSGTGLYCENGGALHPAPRRYFIDGRAFKKKSDPSMSVGKLYRDVDGKILDGYHRSEDLLSTINRDWNKTYDNDAFDPTKYSRAGTRAYAVRECARAWQLHLESSGKKSKGYMNHAEMFFRLHINPVIGDLNVRAITPSQIEALQKHLQEKQLAEVTVKNILATLMTMFQRLHKRGLDIGGYNVTLDKIPVFPEDWSKVEPTRKKWIDEDTQRVLLDRMDGWLKLWARIFYETGARMGEICALQRCDVLPDRTIYVQHAIDFVTNEMKSTKTMEQRTVRISEELYQEIAALPIVGEAYLFLSKKGKPYTSGMISTMLREVYDGAGMFDLKPNCSGRHSMATKKKNEGIRDAEARSAEQLGHASPTMTRNAYIQDESTRIHLPDIKRMEG